MSGEHKHKGEQNINERDQSRADITYLPVMVTVLAMVGVNNEGEVVTTHFHGDQIGAYLPRLDGAPATNPEEALVPSQRLIDRIKAMADGLTRHIIVSAADLLIKTMPNRAQEEQLIDAAVERVLSSAS